jgi:hypothetical protein
MSTYLRCEQPRRAPGFTLRRETAARLGSLPAVRPWVDVTACLTCHQELRLLDDDEDG